MEFLVVALLIGMVGSEGTLWQEKSIPSVEFLSIDFTSEFNDWKIYFRKRYTNTQDETLAFATWKSNWKMVNEWNNNGQHSYTLKMNQFSDLTSDQFKSKYTLANGYISPANKQRFSRTINSIQDLPDSIDWSNVTGPVENQGQEDNSGTIAVAKCLAGFRSASVGKLTPVLSVNELNDCVKERVITPDDCWQFIVNNSGLCSQASYPPVTNGKCEKDKCSSIDPITSYIDVNAVGNSTALQYALLNGPVVIGVEADQTAFQMYSSGVLNTGCGDKIDHYMVVVGYGVESGNKYWKCQNTWGASWGEKGFILLCRDCNQNNGNGVCGILKDPSFPVLS